MISTPFGICNMLKQSLKHKKSTVSCQSDVLVNETEGMEVGENWLSVKQTGVEQKAPS